MSFFQDTFDPATSAYNAKVRAANRKRMSIAMGKNVAYKNRGAAFRQAKWGAAVDISIAASNVRAQALKNQYAAFQGFESFARTRAGKTGPTGEGSRTAERGRTANYMALLAKRQDIEHGLRESFGAAYHSALHQNAVKSQNKQMAARTKLGLRPARKGLAGTRGMNWNTGLFNMAKTAMGIATSAANLDAAGQDAGWWEER